MGRQASTAGASLSPSSLLSRLLTFCGKLLKTVAAWLLWQRLYLSSSDLVSPAVWRGVSRLSWTFSYWRGMAELWPRLLQHFCSACLIVVPCARFMDLCDSSRSGRPSRRHRGAGTTSRVALLRTARGFLPLAPAAWRCCRALHGASCARAVAFTCLARTPSRHLPRYALLNIAPASFLPLSLGMRARRLGQLAPWRSAAVAAA